MFLLFETSDYDVNFLIYKCKIAVTINFVWPPLTWKPWKLSKISLKRTDRRFDKELEEKSPLQIKLKMNILKVCPNVHTFIYFKRKKGRPICWNKKFWKVINCKNCRQMGLQIIKLSFWMFNYPFGSIWPFLYRKL